MLLQDVIQKSRTLLNDVKRNINATSDTIYSDDTLLMFFNEAIVVFQHETLLNSIVREDTEFNINLVKNQDLYSYPDTISQIKMVTLKGDGQIETKLSLMLDEDLPISPSFIGRPTYYILNYQNGKIKFFPNPDKEYIVKFNGYRDIEEYTIDDLQTQCPFDKKYHMFFVYYICSSVFAQNDSDSDTKAVRNEYLSKREYYIQMARRDKARKIININSIVFDNGGYL